MSSGTVDVLRLRSSVRDFKRPNLWLATLAELLGTLLFVFLGCASLFSRDLTNVSLCFGLGIAALVWIFGDVSGGHFNPAVTLAMLVTRRISLLRALLYFAAQLIGSVIGTAIDRGAIMPNELSSNFCVTMPAIKNGPAVAIELLATVVLVLTFFATFDSARNQSGSGALAIGLSVSLCHFAFLPVTGASMNPARSFGPAVLAKNLDQHWIYWIAPLLGGLIAGPLYDIAFAKGTSLARTRRLFVVRNFNPEDPEPTDFQPYVNDQENE